MSQDTVVSFSLEVNLDEAYEEIRRLETLLYRSLGLIRRVSGNEDLNRAIDVFRRGVAAANALRLAIIALETASGPVGWALAGVGLATGMMAASDFAVDVMSR